ncbi:MAG: ankyrin repeat domain-containing protein [Thermoanaerobaculales bacterium]|jgi:hypothetical protein|nr:ankyrin repeat domain-containing protein [Thermoanaerobaculales bacterium]
MRAPGVNRWLVVAGWGLAAALATADGAPPDIVEAARRGDSNAVHRLIEADPAVVGTRDAAGDTALYWAGLRGHWRIVAELVAAGAPVNAAGGDGGTPLHGVCHHDRADIAALLLDAGADPGIADRSGRTPLHVAARRGNTAVASLLVERGADLAATTQEGWTPLHVAAMSRHPELVELLLGLGADPAALDQEGRSAAGMTRPRPPSVAIDPAALDGYVGLYALGDGATVKVWREGDRLRIRELAPDTLDPIGADAFFCEAEPCRVEFVRGADGAVTAVLIQDPAGSVEGTRMPSPRYVGVAACASCHSALEKGNPHVVWMQSRHGHAYWRLGADWALYLARLRPHNADLERPMDDERCLLCHVTGRQDDDALLAETFRAEEGVGCESCHGPGSLYMDPEVMADRAAFVAAGGRVPDEATCRSCHRRIEDFDFAEFSEKIRHWVSEG